MSLVVTRRLFSVEDYYEMANSGILTEDDRVELLDGEIVEMSPIGSRHAGCVKRLTKMIDSQIGDAAILSVQDPIRLSPRSEPQPDLALLKPRADFYTTTHPAPKDVLLVIEVAETSAEPDHKIKLPLYAKAGIPEVWIFELRTKRVEAYRKPSGRKYLVVETYNEERIISPQALPDLQVDSSEIFRLM